MAETSATTKSSPKSGAERVKAHRDRRKAMDVQIAVGVARLVLGQGPGEQRRALVSLLEKTSVSNDLPGDYASVIERAMAELQTRSFR